MNPECASGKTSVANYSKNARIPVTPIGGFKGIRDVIAQVKVLPAKPASSRFHPIATATVSA